MDDFEIFAMKHRTSIASNHSRRTSLLPSQMIHSNEIKVPRRRLSSSQNSNDGKKMRNNEFGGLQDIKEYETSTIPENEEIDTYYNNTKKINVADSRSSKETLSNIGIDNTYRRNSKTYSEVSSIFNRDQRKNTLLK